MQIPVQQGLPVQQQSNYPSSGVGKGKKEKKEKQKKRHVWSSGAHIPGVLQIEFF